MDFWLLLASGFWKKQSIATRIAPMRKPKANLNRLPNIPGSAEGRRAATRTKGEDHFGHFLANSCRFANASSSLGAICRSSTNGNAASRSRSGRVAAAVLANAARLPQQRKIRLERKMANDGIDRLGHPGEPTPGPDIPPALAEFAHANFGLTFENEGLRHKCDSIVRRAQRESRRKN